MLKLLYLTLMICVLASWVHASDDSSFRRQDANAAFDGRHEETTDATHRDPDGPFDPATHWATLKTIRILSSDNETFIVEKSLAECSGVLMNMLQDMGEMDPVFPLQNVTAKTLQKVVEWCDHHRSDPIITDDNERRRHLEIDAWDQQFLQVDQETLFDIILAAYYLDIKELVDAGTKTVANMIRGMSGEELRNTFNIVDGFTPEEEEQFRKENEWQEAPIGQAEPNPWLSN